MSNDDYDDKDLDFTRKPPPVPPPPAPAAAKPAAQRPTPPAVAAAAPAATPARGAPSGAPRSVAAATAQPAAPAGAQQRRLIASKAEFAAALDEVIGRTERSLRIFDPTLAGFGFNTAARDEQLRTFLLKRRSNRAHDKELSLEDEKILHDAETSLLSARETSPMGSLLNEELKHIFDEAIKKLPVDPALIHADSVGS